jgi:hypothetical protein
MIKICYSGFRFPPEIIQQAIWLYLRFTLSFRAVEDLLAERGIMVSHETVRRWMNHFGPMIAADLRKRRPKPHTTWHLDEVNLKISKEGFSPLGLRHGAPFSGATYLRDRRRNIDPMVLPGGPAVAREAACLARLRHERRRADFRGIRGSAARQRKWLGCTERRIVSAKIRRKRQSQPQLGRHPVEQG